MNANDLFEEALSHSVIGAFYHVHKELGFGFREYIYALAMQRELILRGHRVDREVSVLVYYRGERLARQTLDMIVDEKLVLECKVADKLHSSARLQLLSYLNATNLEVGLGLNFGRQATFHRVICENRFKKHRAQFASSTTACP